MRLRLNSAAKRTVYRISARGLISGAAHLLDIFATRARPTRRRTPADDARNLHRDLEKIGQDFSRVLSGINSASNNKQPASPVSAASRLPGAYHQFRIDTERRRMERCMTRREIVKAAGGAGLRLSRGEHLRIIDIEGGQTGDLIAFSQDGRERLSNGRTFDYGGKIYLSTGDVLWSDRSNSMLTIVEDSVGRHDFLYASCSLEMYRIQYGVTGYHANCHDNLRSALKAPGIEPDSLPTAFNFFMRANVSPDGALEIAPPQCRAGDFIVLRAEMDLSIALSACPCSSCNGGGPPKPLAYEIAAR